MTLTRTSVANLPWKTRASLSAFCTPHPSHELGSTWQPASLPRCAPALVPTPTTAPLDPEIDSSMSSMMLQGREHEGALPSCQPPAAESFKMPEQAADSAVTSSNEHASSSSHLPPKLTPCAPSAQLFSLQHASGQCSPSGFKAPTLRHAAVAGNMWSPRITLPGAPQLR